MANVLNGIKCSLFVRASHVGFKMSASVMLTTKQWLCDVLGHCQIILDVSKFLFGLHLHKQKNVAFLLSARNLF